MLWPNMLAVMHPAGCARSARIKASELSFRIFFFAYRPAHPYKQRSCAEPKRMCSPLSTERSFSVSPQTSPAPYSAARTFRGIEMHARAAARQKKDSGTGLEAPYTAYAATVPGAFPRSDNSAPTFALAPPQKGKRPPDKVTIKSLSASAKTRAPRASRVCSRMPDNLEKVYNPGRPPALLAWAPKGPSIFLNFFIFIITL